MKINQYMKKSLTTQFIVLISFFILFFVLVTVSIFFTQKNMYDSYVEERAQLVHKANLVRNIEKTMNTAMFDIRGYFAFENVELKSNALSKQSVLTKYETHLKKIAVTSEDNAFTEDLSEFTNYYFIDNLPTLITFFENGEKDKVIDFAQKEGTKKVNTFQEKMQLYSISLSKQLDDKVTELMRKQTYMQIGFVVFNIAILFVLFRIIRVMLKEVGQPLAQFAYAANEIAKGNDAEITVDTNRKDELGTLSIAFKKMVASLQEKEQDLLAQNEELIAQQDELQAQQRELEDALEVLKINDAKLIRRNELINNVSTSLNKQEVLDSIIINMTKIVDADKGIITMMKENSFAAFGMSEIEINQIQTNRDSGFISRLLTEKVPYFIKRELLTSEKGIHVGLGYCHDLYLPILSSNQEVTAFMILSRFSQEFPKRLIEEYEALSKQIGVSLDKINIYEKSEEDRKLNKDILNTVQEGIQLVDVSGRIVQVNDQLCDIFIPINDPKELEGLSLEEWATILFEDIQDAQEFEKFINSVIKNEIQAEETFTYMKLHDNQVMKVYYEHLYQGPKRVGTIFVHRDITKEYEVDQMKSEFVSTVSHELRTPLASILGFTELLINRELHTEKQKKYLNTIFNEAKRLTALINDFLDVQRMEAGKQTYEKKFIQVVPIIEKVIENVQINTSIHPISIENQVETNIILGDKTKVEHIFTNLIENAIKYSPNGGPIQIKVYSDKNHLKVDVSDKGLGIPIESINKVFTKFYRVDNSDRRTIGGTGLGLAIVQEIVKAHDGDITVSSEYGEGSTFTVSFPTIKEKMHIVKDDLESVYTNRYKIMLVEDDLSLAELISHELVESGFKVEHYLKGKDALAALEIGIPDALVLDIMLEEDQNEIDGWKIINIIKENPVNKNIPIIVSTALDEKEKGISLGATDYLVKPYKPNELSKAIMQTLLNIGKMGQILIPKDDIE